MYRVSVSRVYEGNTGESLALTWPGGEDLFFARYGKISAHQTHPDLHAQRSLAR